MRHVSAILGCFTPTLVAGQLSSDEFQPVINLDMFSSAWCKLSARARSRNLPRTCYSSCIKADTK